MRILRTFLIMVLLFLLTGLAFSLGINPDWAFGWMMKALMLGIVAKVVMFFWREAHPVVTPPAGPRPTYGRAIPNSQVIQMIRKTKERDNRN